MIDGPIDWEWLTGVVIAIIIIMIMLEDVRMVKEKKGNEVA